MASSGDAPPSSSAAQSNEASLPSIIASYLKKKGYNRSIEGLATDLGVSVDKIAVSMDLINDSTVLQAISTYNSSEKFPGSFEQSFSALCTWIDRSLDQCKPELSSVLYPLFVHGYLDLVKKGQQLFASQFMLSHLDEVEADHRDEVYKLLVVQTPDHLKENEVAQLWLQNRYKLSMSSFSYDLLMSFLQEQNFLLIRTMINEHVAISTYAGYPSQRIESLPILDKNSQDLLDAPSQTDVYWGVYKDLRKWYEMDEEEEDVAGAEEKEKNENAMDADAPAVEEDAASKKRKRESTAAAAKRKAARAKAEAKAPPADKRVPVQTNLGADTEAELLADLRSRVKLSSEVLPSIALYTIFNTHNNMTCSAVSKEAGIVACGFGDSSIKLWDVQSDSHLSTGQSGTSFGPSRWQQAQQNYVDSDGRVAKYKTAPSVYSELIGHSQSVTSLEFSPDSAYLLSSSADGTVRLWSNETKTNVVCYRGHNFPVWQTKFAPLGYYFASASHDRTARLWVTSNVHAMRIFAGHGSDVNTVAFHPNYYYLLTGSSDKTLRLWEVHTGDCVRIFAAHQASIYDAQVSPDGRFAVSAGEDAVVNIWDLAAGKRCGALKGHTGPIWSVDISPDGSTLASGSSDHSVRLWDLRMLGDSDASAGSGGAASTSASSSAPASSSAASGAANAASNPTLYSYDPAKWEKASLGVYPTKSTPVFKVAFTRRNLLTASGPFRAPALEPSS
jgi:transcription initiation factor TFIID subunit 5